jgi:hypothetical protein
MTIKGLVNKMPGLQKAVRSENTIRKYQLYFLKFRQFMIDNNKCSLPASSMLVTIFVVHLLENNCSYSIVCSYAYSIKCIHNLYGYSDPTDSVHVKDLLSSSKRNVNKPRFKKDIVTPFHIKSLFELYADSQDSFVIRDVTVIIISFFSVLYDMTKCPI